MKTAKPTRKLENSFDPNEVMDGLAVLVGIEIPEASRTMVATHLQVAASMADIVQAAPLDHNKMEPANVFTPASVAEDTANNPGPGE